MKLILIRHGETIENAKRILQGQLDTRLSKKGIEQAKKVALRLQDKHIDRIYSSDLKRAYNTAKEIQKYHQDISIITDKRLRERYFASLEGKRILGDGWWNNLPKEAETHEDIIARAKSFIFEMLKKYPNKTILAVTHGGFKRAATAILHNKTWNEVNDEFQFKNTSLSIYDITKEKTKPLVVTCTKHLDSENDINKKQTD